MTSDTSLLQKCLRGDWICRKLLKHGVGDWTRTSRVQPYVLPDDDPLVLPRKRRPYSGPLIISFAVRRARSLISGIETIGKICGETRLFAALSPKFVTPSFRSATKLYLEEGYPIAELHLQSSSTALIVMWRRPSMPANGTVYYNQGHGETLIWNGWHGGK